MAVNNLDKKAFESVFARPEYKSILKAVKSGLGQLSDKYLVDTIVSLGKLHKSQTKDPS